MRSSKKVLEEAMDAIYRVMGRSLFDNVSGEVERDRGKFFGEDGFCFKRYQRFRRMIRVRGGGGSQLTSSTFDVIRHST